jgi:hypothetical protein
VREGHFDMHLTGKMAAEIVDDLFGFVCTEAGVAGRSGQKVGLTRGS